MGSNKKKMKLPFASQPKSSSLDPKLYSSFSSSSSSSSPPWPFPSCGNIRTISFRAKDDDVDFNDNKKNDDAFRTFNSAFLEAESTPPESFFSTVSSSSRSFSTLSDEDSGDPLETVIRGLKSERLFFEPEQSSSLFLSEHELMQAEEDKDKDKDKDECKPQQDISNIKYARKEVAEDEEEVVYKESEIMSMDSNSPYEDFKRSMEEMVEAHGLKDWQGLEELLGCYLKINAKNNHGYIIGAFVDLLVSLSFTSFESSTSSSSSTSRITTTSTTNTTTTTISSHSNFSSPSSPLSLPSSSLTTPCLSSILDHGDDEHDDEDEGNDDHAT